MKRYAAVTILLVLAGLTVISCAPLPAATTSSTAAANSITGTTAITGNTLTTVTIKVPTMTWSTCAARITKNVQKVNGVQNAQTDLTNRTVTVTFDAANTTPADIVQAIEAGGDTTDGFVVQ